MACKARTSTTSRASIVLHAGIGICDALFCKSVGKQREDCEWMNKGLGATACLDGGVVPRLLGYAWAVSYAPIPRICFKSLLTILGARLDGCGCEGESVMVVTARRQGTQGLQEVL